MGAPAARESLGQPGPPAAGRRRHVAPLVAALLLAAAVLAGAYSFLAGSAPALAGSAAFGAGSSSSAPGVVTAAVRQSGADLILSVTLARPFAPARLGRGGDELCLLLERARTGTVRAQLCLTAPRRRGGSPGLELAAVTRAGPGTARTIPASILLHGSRALSVSFAAQRADIAYRPLRWQVKSATARRRCAAKPTCAVLVPARPALLRLHTPQLVGCAAAGPSLAYGGSTKRHDIALSFDDGPWDDPPSIDFVHLLAHLHVPATFFEIGEEIANYDRSGAVERAMLADGDMIGDHTFTHPDMALLPAAEQRSQLTSTATAIRQATGFTPCLWRPPYDDLSPSLISLARRLGFLTIDWDIDPRDWATPGVASIERTVIDDARNGGIVEMHFGGGPRQETLEALPDIVATLRRRGYQFVTITQMLGLRLIYR